MTCELLQVSRFSCIVPKAKARSLGRGNRETCQLQTLEVPIVQLFVICIFHQFKSDLTSFSISSPHTLLPFHAADYISKESESDFEQDYAQSRSVACDHSKCFVFVIFQDVVELARGPPAYHSAVFNPVDPSVFVTASSVRGIELWDSRVPMR